MKFLGNKKLTLPLFIAAVVVTSCFDPINNQEEQPQQEVVQDSTKTTAQLIPIEWGEYSKE